MRNCHCHNLWSWYWILGGVLVAVMLPAQRVEAMGHIRPVTRVEAMPTVKTEDKQASMLDLPTPLQSDVIICGGRSDILNVDTRWRLPRAVQLDETLVYVVVVGVRSSRQWHEHLALPRDLPPEVVPSAET